MILLEHLKTTKIIKMIFILDLADIYLLFVLLPRCYEIIISLLYEKNHAINISNFLFLCLLPFMITYGY